MLLCDTAKKMFKSCCKEKEKKKKDHKPTKEEQEIELIHKIHELIETCEFIFFALLTTNLLIEDFYEQYEEEHHVMRKINGV